MTSDRDAAIRPATSIYWTDRRICQATRHAYRRRRWVLGGYYRRCDRCGDEVGE